jgi:signal peptide peptidase SppA
MSKQNIMPLVLGRLVNTPLLLSPTKAAIIHDVIQGRAMGDFAVDVADTPKPEASQFKGSMRKADGGYSILPRAQSVAIITIDGSLVNRGAYIGASSGVVSYEGIGAQIDAAKADPEIKAAIIDMNSHGGEATGMVNIAQKVRELAAVMPVIAVVNDVAASAGYGIACGATEIVVSPTSFVGSIGVVMVHSDHSSELKKKGVKVTILQKGAAKTHGHPFGPITGEGAVALDKMMSVLYEQFLETVEAGRGDRLNADAARKTEAGIFIGQDAVDAGIADRIGTFDAILDELQSNARSGTTTENATMANDPKNPDASGKTFTQADIDAATAAGATAGAQASADRFNAIMASPEAKGREATAQGMALNADMAAMSADAVIKVLGTTPLIATADTTTTTPTPEQRAEGAPEMGADDLPTGAPAKDAAASSGWDAVVKDHNANL